MKKLTTIALVLAYFSANTTSPGTCQTQYNNSSSQCDTQYQLDIQVSDAFSSATGGLSYGTILKKSATKKYNECVGRAITARSNCNDQR